MKPRAWESWALKSVLGHVFVLEILFLNRECGFFLFAAWLSIQRCSFGSCLQTWICKTFFSLFHEEKLQFQYSSNKFPCAQTPKASITHSHGLLCCCCQTSKAAPWQPDGGYRWGTRSIQEGGLSHRVTTMAGNLTAYRKPLPYDKCPPPLQK